MFSVDQWKALVGLLGNARILEDQLNAMFDFNFWIIDTGATHHLTGEITWLFDLVDIPPCHVELPNSDSVVGFCLSFSYYYSL